MNKRPLHIIMRQAQSVLFNFGHCAVSLGNLCQKGYELQPMFTWHSLGYPATSRIQLCTPHCFALALTQAETVFCREFQA